MTWTDRIWLAGWAAAWLINVSIHEERAHTWIIHRSSFITGALLDFCLPLVNKHACMIDHSPLLSLVVLAASLALVLSTCRSSVPGSDWAENWRHGKVWSSERLLPRRSQTNVSGAFNLRRLYSTGNLCRLPFSSLQHCAPHLDFLWCWWWCWWREWRRRVGETPPPCSGGSCGGFAHPFAPGHGAAAGSGSWSRRPFPRSERKEHGSWCETEKEKRVRKQMNGKVCEGDPPKPREF